MTNATKLVQSCVTTLLCMGWLAVAPAAAQTTLDNEHTDLQWHYDGGQWSFLVSDETHDIQYPASQVLLSVGPNSLLTQPNDPRFSFLGAGAGNPVWILPQAFDPSRLFLGFNTENIPTGIFASYMNTDPRVNATDEWVKITLLNLQGPAGGKISLYQQDPAGNPIVWWSTQTGDNTFFTPTNTDSHSAWGFTAAGDYSVTFQASAFLGPGETNPTMSETETVHFTVSATAAPVPEPATLGLVAVGCCGLVGVYLRRRYRN
jgi:surface-anchored protein